jgi:hypothetical protein
MEEPAVACGALGAQHVIMRDTGDLWVSSRTLARALDYAKPSNLTVLFEGTDHAPVDRSSFPPACLSYPEEARSHYFLRLSHLLVVLNKKYLPQVCDITASVQSFFGRKLLAGRVVEGPRSRSSSAALPPKARRVSESIQDVPVPPATWVDPRPPRPPHMAEADAGAIVRRLTFDHVEFSGAQSPAFVGRQAAAAETDRVLRSIVRQSLGLQESIASAPLEQQVPETDFGLEVSMYRAVVERAGRRVEPLEKRPLVQLETAIRSSRSIDDVTRCANALDHDVVHVGNAGGGPGGKFSWVVKLDFYKQMPAVKIALSFFNMIRTVEIWSRRAVDKREWCARSEYVGQEDMRVLLEALVSGPMPVPAPHTEFSGPLPKLFAEKHPWVADNQGTSLGKKLPILLPDGCEMVMVSKSVLAVMATWRRCCGKKCAFSLSAAVGLEAVAHFKCMVCTVDHALPLFAGEPSVLNHTAYVAQMMSGRPKAISRFLQSLSIGKIPNRGSSGSFLDMLLRAVEPVYKECSTVLFFSVLRAELAHDGERRRGAQAHGKGIFCGNGRGLDKRAFNCGSADEEDSLRGLF